MTLGEFIAALKEPDHSGKAKNLLGLEVKFDTVYRHNLEVFSVYYDSTVKCIRIDVGDTEEDQ